MAVLAGAVSVLGYTECQNQEKTIISRGGYFMTSPGEFDNIYQSSFRVDGSLTLEEKCNDSSEFFYFGSGVLLRDAQTQDDFILTANHVIPGSSYLCEEDSSERNIKMKGSLSVAGFPAVVVKQDQEADQALLKIEGNITDTPYLGKVARNLRPQDYVVGVGFPGGDHLYFFANVTEKKENLTLLNIKMIGGSSGGGVFRLSDRGLQLIGTVRGGTAITSLDKLREFFKGTVLEDDYL